MRYSVKSFVMKLEDQLCPLEHARRLKELGAAQQSLCYYSDKGVVLKTLLGFIPLREEQGDVRSMWKDLDTSSFIAAFTVAELGVALPPSLEAVDLTTEKSEEMNFVSYPGLKTTFGKTEAQARANMLIWLIENKYATVREINGRLAESG
jgi:hypothetical protein